MKINDFFIAKMLCCLLLTACSTQPLPSEESIYDVKAENHSNHLESDTIEVNSSHASEWSYEGKTGPKHWGELDPAYSTCAKGKEQSPINIEASQLIESTSPEKMIIQSEPTTFTLVNTGHTIQANPITKRNVIVLDGKTYSLEQLHFHTPSEHQFNGKNFAMEFHLVHKDPYGKLAVLGVMVQEGSENEILAAAWNALPKKELDKSIVKEPIDVKTLIPHNQTGFHYNGSLTTPPCTEGIKWIVFEQPIQMSKNQIQVFKGIFPDNHRPVQPINQREIIKK
ncbi:carbonic anhydrase [Niallia oryzisoli]|uniref:carbonic anhydrase n=1 Tax=Niallia oryzisoli TaxID=1737571 RepID=UPI0037356751